MFIHICITVEIREETHVSLHVKYVMFAQFYAKLVYFEGILQNPPT
jgi:hypothetical protein